MVIWMTEEETYQKVWRYEQGTAFEYGRWTELVITDYPMAGFGISRFETLGSPAAMLVGWLVSFPPHKFEKLPWYLTTVSLKVCPNETNYSW
jgi:hypothetical protein